MLVWLMKMEIAMRDLGRTREKPSGEFYVFQFLESCFANLFSSVFCTTVVIRFPLGSTGFWKDYPEICGKNLGKSGAGG